LKADELHGYFKEVEAKTEDGEKYELERIEAIGNVKVISPDKIATGEYGNYYLDKEQIILERNVVISDGANEVKGGYGIMNRNEGTTQVYSSKPGTKQTKKKRVTAFLAKTKKDSKK
jgi:lipopolysaccharide export system protein LptA